MDTRKPGLNFDPGPNGAHMSSSEGEPMAVSMRYPRGSSAGHVPAAGAYAGTVVTSYDGILDGQNFQGPSVAPYIQIQARTAGPPKKTETAYKMAILGFLGLHHFYLGRPKFGVLYLFTGGLLIAGWLIDLCRLPMLVKQANDMIVHPEKYRNKRTMLDAYILWFPLGIFGAHHYYLGRMSWGVAYTFTMGFFGVGWAIDGARMKQLVRDVNELSERRPAPIEDEDDKKLSECYVLAVSPLGMLGAHYYYLERWSLAVMYTFTLGLFGIGWFVDLCTLPYVFERAEKIRRKEVDPNQVYLTEAYKLIFPLGFLGLHHFYLRRPGWGVLYICTVGLLCIGWLIDFFRLPCLVKEVNLAAEKEAANLSELQNRLHGQTSQGIELPPSPEPPGYSTLSLPPGRRHPQFRPEDPYLQQQFQLELPPPYTLRDAPQSTSRPGTSPARPAAPSRPVTSPVRPVISPQPMDMITEEDEEDAISVISGASRQMASNNDVSLENSLNDQIYESNKAAMDTAF